MKIIIGGDVSTKSILTDKIVNGDFEGIMGEIKPLFKSADYAIVNFETTIPNDSDSPIKKVGPNLKTTPKLIDLLKWAGVNVVTLANNHVGDYGPKALLRAISELKKQGIQYVGAGENKDDAAKILYLSDELHKIAIINCCEHEYGIATEKEAGSNLLNPISQFYAIKEAKKNAEYVFVIVHGGHEYFQLPSIRMQNTYRFFIDCGADIVINGHQHCFSGMEIYNGKPIYYGLGNLLFNNISKYKPIGWDEGILIEIDIKDDKLHHKYIPYSQCARDLGIHLLPDNKDFNKRFDKLSVIISNKTLLEQSIDSYYSESQKFIDDRIQPWPNRFLRIAFNKGFLPSLFNKASLRGIHNIVSCESHLDKLIYYLENKAF